MAGGSIFRQRNVDEGPDPSRQGDGLQSVAPRKRWRILVVDDEEEVHSVTRLVLDDMLVEERKLEIVSCHSAAEARALLQRDQNFAIALVDVVMETDDAGFELVKFIREELGNSLMRIVLRTGQPGMAPEEQVIQQLDINDYKDKTELTNTKFKTLIYATIRAYRDMLALDNHRKGLERLIQASNQVFDNYNLHEFASAVLHQLVVLLGLEERALYCHSLSAWAASSKNNRLHVLAATGDEFAGCVSTDRVPAEVLDYFEEAIRCKHSLKYDHCFIGYARTRRQSENLLYVSHEKPLTELDENLLNLYAESVGIAFENIAFHQEVQATQKDMIYLLSEMAEKREMTGSQHVRRVAEISAWLAEKAGLDKEHVVSIRDASPLHDIGKMTIPETIIGHPGSLDEQAWQVMQQHAFTGGEILKHSDKRIIQLAARIALEHHERWDGKGYPAGKQGEAIDIAARIVGIADVVDVLASDNAYKTRWDDEKIIAYLKEQRGCQFDPALVDIVLEHYADIIELRSRFPDQVTPTA